MRFLFTALIVCLLAAMAACKQPADGIPSATPDAGAGGPTATQASGATDGPTGTAEPTEPPSASSGDFTVATEYGVVGLADAYRGTGLDYAKLTLEFGVWGNLEPEPGNYTWGPMDGLVAEYQEAGYTGLQLVISAENGWASKSTAVFAKEHFPKDEYVGDYREFVKAFVERYDGDG